METLPDNLVQKFYECFDIKEVTRLQEIVPKWSRFPDKRNSPFAWVTLVMKGDDYVQGALPLAYSLQKSQTIYPCVCMVTPDVSDVACQRLAAIYDQIVEVDYFQAPCPPMRTEFQENVYGSWINQSFTKWRCLQLKDYKKVVFLDADMIILSNMDDLFQLPTPAGTFSNAFGWPYGKETKRRPAEKGEPPRGMYNPYYGLKHGRVVPPAMIEKGLNSNSFAVCGTTLLLEPSQTKWQELEQILHPPSHEPVFGFRSCYSGYDEQVITWLYHRDQRCRWTMISQIYNYIPWQYKWLRECGEGKTQYGRPRVFHYIMRKPWATERGTWADNEVYWQIVETMIAYAPNDKTSQLLRDTYSPKILQSKPSKSVGCAYCEIWNLAHPEKRVESATHHFLDSNCQIQCPIYKDASR
jgi:hypothetical protein